MPRRAALCAGGSLKSKDYSLRLHRAFNEFSEDLASARQVSFDQGTTRLGRWVQNQRGVTSYVVAIIRPLEAAPVRLIQQVPTSKTRLLHRPSYDAITSKRSHHSLQERRPIRRTPSLHHRHSNGYRESPDIACVDGRSDSRHHFWSYILVIHQNLFFFALRELTRN